MKVKPCKNKWINFTWSKRENIVDSAVRFDRRSDLVDALSLLVHVLRPNRPLLEGNSSITSDSNDGACLETSLWRHSSHFSPFPIAFCCVVFLLHLMLLFLKIESFLPSSSLTFHYFVFWFLDQSSFKILFILTLAKVAMT